MTDYKRPKLHLPLALLAGKDPATKPGPFPIGAIRYELRHLVAAMID
jgi:hypothetical protein